MTNNEIRESVNNCVSLMNQKREYGWLILAIPAVKYLVDKYCDLSKEAMKQGYDFTITVGDNSLKLTKNSTLQLEN